MHIYISGMSNTGKTTMINGLKDLLKRKPLPLPITFVEELSRNYFKEHNYGHKSYADLLLDYESCFEYWKGLIAEFESTRKYFDLPRYICIFDRGPIDYRVNLILNYSAGSEELMKKYNMDFASLYASIEDPGLLDYTFSTSTTLSEDLTADGFRPTDMNYRRSMEKILFDLANGNQPNHRMNLPSSTEDRVRIIYDHLKKYCDR